MNHSQTFPIANWPLTQRYLNEMGWMEGRDYTVTHGVDRTTLRFEYSFSWKRYWQHWGRHLVSL